MSTSSSSMKKTQRRQWWTWTTDGLEAVPSMQSSVQSQTSERRAVASMRWESVHEVASVTSCTSSPSPESWGENCTAENEEDLTAEAIATGQGRGAADPTPGPGHGDESTGTTRRPWSGSGHTRRTRSARAGLGDFSAKTVLGDVEDRVKDKWSQCSQWKGMWCLF